MVATPLHCAVFAKQIEIVEELLKCSASASSTATIIPDALRKLTSEFDTWSLAFSAAHLPTSKKTHTVYSGSAWSLACRKHASDIVKISYQSHSWKSAKSARSSKWVITNLSDIDTLEATKRRDGITIFMVGAQGSRSNTLEYLLQMFGHDLVNARDSSGWTALHYAAYEDRAKCSDALIRVGAGINDSARNGSTPLMLAAEAGKEKSLGRLLTTGASTEIQDHRKQTALHRASTSQCVTLLLQNKAPVDALDEFNQTPLIKFACDGHVQLLRAMIEAGIDVQSANQYDETALYGAARWNHVDCIQLLLRHGASMEKKTQRGWTALGVAVRENCAESVDILLKAGAKPDNRHGGPTSLLNIAAKNGNMPIVCSLLAAKANPNGWRSKRVPEGERTTLACACYRGSVDMVRAFFAGTRPDLAVAYTAPIASQGEIVKLMHEFAHA